MIGCRELAHEVSIQLSKIYDKTEADEIARWLIESELRISKTAFVLNEKVEITSRFKRKLIRLNNHEPIQYVLDEAYFYGLLLQVNASVLIPRPETELLVDAILKSHDTQERTVFDFCSGSGCIGLALKANRPLWEVSLFEKSELALEVSEANSKELKLPVAQINCDLLEASSSDFAQKADIIVSNPPYVLPKEAEDMRANVMDFEPHMALFVPETDPLIFYRKIGELGREILKPRGALYFEINENFGQNTAELLIGLSYKRISILKDQYYKDRMIEAFKD